LKTLLIFIILFPLFLIGQQPVVEKISAQICDSLSNIQTNIEDLNIHEFIEFFEPYRQYILSGDEADKAMESIHKQNAADSHYAQQERSMMGGG
jgi:hypothetical protein